MKGDQGKYRHVARLLRGRIVRGVYKGRFPGEDRLAEELNVAPFTVRTALAYLEGQGFVRRERRKGTFAQLPGGGSGNASVAFVRLFLLGYEEAVWAMTVLDSFREAASNHGLKAVVSDLGQCSSDTAPNGHIQLPGTWKREVLVSAAEPRSVGTVLLTVPVSTADALDLAQANSPIVVLDWEVDEPILSSVVCDNKGAGALAALNLLKLGHRRIGWMQRESPLPLNHSLRLDGVRETLAKSGLSLHCELVRRSDDAFSEQMTKLLRGPSPPTAIICGNAYMVMTLVGLIVQAGLNVPKDISVLGIGGPKNTMKSLLPTMVSVGFPEMGEKAVELLLDEEALTHPRREVVPCRLDEGNTTAALHA